MRDGQKDVSVLCIASVNSEGDEYSFRFVRGMGVAWVGACVCKKSKMSAIRLLFGGGGGDRGGVVCVCEWGGLPPLVSFPVKQQRLPPPHFHWKAPGVGDGESYSGALQLKPWRKGHAGSIDGRLVGLNRLTK